MKMNEYLYCHIINLDGRKSVSNVDKWQCHFLTGLNIFALGLGRSLHGTIGFKHNRFSVLNRILVCILCFVVDSQWLPMLPTTLAFLFFSKLINRKFLYCWKPSAEMCCIFNVNGEKNGVPKRKFIELEHTFKHDIFSTCIPVMKSYTLGMF